MPKKNKEETEKTISTIKQAVIEQMLALGYDKMSYTTLSEQTGISRTGISHHFPRKIDFANAINESLFAMMIEHLEFETTVEGFKASWLNALDNPQFASILRLLIRHVVVSEGSLAFAKRGLDDLYQYAQVKLGKESEAVIDWLIGRSVVMMLR